MVHFFALLMALQLLTQGPPNAVPCGDRGGSVRIIAKRPTYDSRTARPLVDFREQAIAVDQDGDVFQLLLGSGGRSKIVYAFGQQKAPPASFPFAGSLPGEQVLVRLRSLTCPEGRWRLWVAVTVGLGKSDIVRAEGYFVRRAFLYVFREGQDGRKTVLKKSDFEISSLEIGDFNHDKTTEIAVQSIGESVSASGTDLSIWRVGPRGQLEAVDLDNVIKGLEMRSGPYQISLGDYVDGNAQVYATEARYLPTGGLLRIVKRYEWDKSKGRYALAQVTRSEEREMK